MLSAGKQTRAEYGDWGNAMPYAPGKQTLVERLPGMSLGSPELDAVAARAGDTFVDGGKYEWVARADGSFEVKSAPKQEPPPPGSKQKAAAKDLTGTVIVMKQKPAVWNALYELLTGSAPQTKSARATAKATPSTPAIPTNNTVAANHADLIANETKLRSESRRKRAGTPLEIANTRAALGDKGTHYHWDAGSDDFEPATPEEKRAIRNGDPNATTFWCSGLVIWSLLEAGYDLNAEIGSFIIVSKSPQEGSIRLDDQSAKNKQTAEALAARAGSTTIDGTAIKPTDYARVVAVTPYSLIEGFKEQVAVMSNAERRGVRSGHLGTWRNLACDGYKVGLDGEATDSVKGAAGSFALAGIGFEVPVGDQKPGDFAQIRRRPKGGGDYAGHGHAYQVWSVKARGSAMFGKEGSPEPVGSPLVGWHADVEFLITKDTAPNLVGKLDLLISEQRLEANTRSTFEDKSGDGGVQITDQKGHEGDGLDAKCFYGRLASSPWATWTPADEPILDVQEDHHVAGRAQESP